MSGFVAIHRSAFDHPLLQDGERFRAWFWMVAKACWKPTRFDVHGQIVTLQRGQFCCSVREMAEAWGWSKSAVDRFIQRLVDEKMVISTRSKTGTPTGTRSGTSRAIITICNYAKYQDVNDDAGTGTGTPSGTAAGQQRDIKEQGNKNNNKNTTSPACAREAPKRAPIKHLIPTDWKPEPFSKGTTCRAIIDGWPPGRIDDETERFIAHHSARGSFMVDWQAAWRTWTLNSRNFDGARNGSTPGKSPHDSRDGFERALDRRIYGQGADGPAVATG